MAAWWQNFPWRMIQTNMREIDILNLDPAKFVEDLDSFHANSVMVSFGGTLANYPSRLENHFINPLLVGDPLKELVELCHQKNIKVIARTDFSKMHRSIYEKHPDWAYTEDGAGVLDSNGYYSTCQSGGFQHAFMDDVIKEIITEYKFYPKEGIPIEYDTNSIISSVRVKDPIRFLTLPSMDFIVSLIARRIHLISNDGISISALPYDKGGSLRYDEGGLIYPSIDTQCSTIAICYHRYEGLVTVHDISSGELIYKQYDAPKNLDYKNVAYSNGNLIYSTSSGLYSLDLEAQTTETLVEGSLAKWQMTTGGVIYTRYITATDIETCFLNLATKETEKLSSSGVEVVSIASFVE